MSAELVQTTKCGLIRATMRNEIGEEPAVTPRGMQVGILGGETTDWLRV